MSAQVLAWIVNIPHDVSTDDLHEQGFSVGYRDTTHVLLAESSQAAELLRWILTGEEQPKTSIEEG